MSTLYRKYRPQIFAELVGQEHIKKVLQNEISSNKIAHAFLFSGPRGIGKTTIARILAKAVNCENRKEGKSEPCNECDSCKEIIESKSLDVIEMDAATHTQVDKVREHIVENVRFTPSRRKYKVFVIDEAHMLSIPSFNALLKTLEEPPAHAIFILATTEIHKIPETIISRCQRFDFHRIGLNDLLSRLKMIALKEGVELDEKVLQAIAQNSDGGLRDAESVLGQILSLSLSSDKKKITMDEANIALPRSNLNLVKEFVSYLIKKDSGSALKFVSRLTEEGISIRRFIDEVIEYLREIITQPSIVKMIEVLLERKQTAQFSKIDELPLELAIVEICGESEAKPVDVVPNATTPPESPSTSLPTPEPPSKSLSTPSEPLSVPSVPLSSPEDSSIPSKFKNTPSLDKILKNWHNILNKAQEYNQSLPLTINNGAPLKIENNVLQIGFQFPLYKDRLNKSRDVMEKICFDILGEKISIEGVVVNESEFEEGKKKLPKIEPSKEKISSIDISAEAEKIAESFGGRVIE
ncbi:MAG: DNA polymerase III subunit gamma/tau [Patescibacteria group bacterium]|nr:DNA polymerase III subunit gamma/tau [Patescibacteria group bacterium]